MHDIGDSWFPCYPANNKTAQETMNSLQKFLPLDRKQVLYTKDTSLDFVRD